jgi:hypothetical protein
LEEKKPPPNPSGGAAPLNVADILKTKFGAELSALNYNSDSEDDDDSEEDWD